MATFYVRITGKVGFTQGARFKESEIGFRMDDSGATGVEIKPVIKEVLCREGNESLTLSPKGAKCAPGQHGIKEKTQVYDIGNGRYACKFHLYSIPTLSKIRQDYNNPRYTGIRIVRI